MSWSVLVYGALLIFLGYLGYQAGSAPSFYAGTAFGGLLVFCALLLFLGIEQAAIVALMATAGLTALFSYRYALAHKPIAGIMAVLSGLMLLYLLSNVFRKLRAK
jgi:uncharacterized membrane protein (UPF0136 family)